MKVVKIIEVYAKPDHIHMLVRIWLKISVTMLMEYSKDMEEPNKAIIKKYGQEQKIMVETL